MEDQKSKNKNKKNKKKKKKKTLINNSDKGSLKDVDILFKITSLQCSRVKKLFDKNFHKWKNFPLFSMKSILEKKFKFHGSLDT